MPEMAQTNAQPDRPDYFGECTILRAIGQCGSHTLDVARGNLFAIEAQNAEDSAQTKQPISARLGAIG